MTLLSNTSLFSAVSSILLLQRAVAFRASLPRDIIINNGHVSTKTVLNLSEMPLIGSLDDTSEEDTMNVMFKALECANSDSCSIADAKEYMRDILHVQSGCAAGTLNGFVLCEDVTLAAEIVSNLRVKIERGQSNTEMSLGMRQKEFAELVKASTGADGTTLSATGALTKAPIQPLYLGMAAFYLFLMVNILGGREAAASETPFTTDEWMMAVRGGYLDNMVTHFIRNGGL